MMTFFLTKMSYLLFRNPIPLLYVVKKNPLQKCGFSVNFLGGKTHQGPQSAEKDAKVRPESSTNSCWHDSRQSNLTNDVQWDKPNSNPLRTFWIVGLVVFFSCFASLCINEVRLKLFSMGGFFRFLIFNEFCRESGDAAALHIEHTSNTHQTHIKHTMSSNTHQTHIKHTSNTQCHQHTSNTHQTHITHQTHNFEVPTPNDKNITSGHEMTFFFGKKKRILKNPCEM